MESARAGKTSYRIRHRAAPGITKKPLVINGYGVELALKRTDYIVIDDRDEDVAGPSEVVAAPEVSLEDQALADLKPLSTSEVFSLSLKAASFIMQSGDPFESLLKISQDFPKYSSAMAAHNTTSEFLKEHQYNRAQLVPAGLNVIWINGVQITPRQTDAFTLLELLRRERKLINGVKELGLSGQEAVTLLSHGEISAVKSNDEPQRYDWRDIEEGGNVIIWLNDIEKDKRYEGWPITLNAVSASIFLYESC